MDQDRTSPVSASGAGRPLSGASARTGGEDAGPSRHAARAAAAAVPATAGPEISIVVPTFNERQNIAELVRRIGETLAGTAWEVIVVDDDSGDGTADLVRGLAETDARVRCIQRIGRRGLSSACIEGFLSSSAPYLAVIDGDLQHDERMLRTMLECLKAEDLDIVIGSRYMAGGSIGDWDGRRARLSKMSTQLAQKTLRVVLSDPMSGFFAMRRDVLHEVVRGLSGVGFKILLDIFVTADRPLRFRELPYEFRTRHAGESKADGMVALDFLTMLIQKKVGRLVPPRLVYFSVIGGGGVAVHLAAFSAAFHGLGLAFWPSQAIAALLAMVANFTLNNIITYRDERLSGRDWIKGLVAFCLVCSVGAIGNVGVASYIFRGGWAWLPSVLAGIVIGTVWNYAATAFYVWHRGR